MELMFRCVDTDMIGDVDKYEDKDEYLHTVKLYHKRQKESSGLVLTIWNEMHLLRSFRFLMTGFLPVMKS